MSKLLVLSPIDARDEIDEHNDRCHNIVLEIVASATSESEAHDALSSAVCKSQASHEEVCAGLVVAILLDNNQAARFFRDLVFVNRDGMVCVITFLNQLIVEKFWKLQESVRSQLLWLTREMIRSGQPGVDQCFFNLLRNIAGGDISSKNLALAENLIDILTEHRAWLDKNPFLIATVVYTLLRLIIDHASVPNLRSKEIDLSLSLLRERFTDCLIIGRELIRLLQNVARIPEFESIWKLLLHNPSALSPGFQGVLQLMQTRTSRRFLQCRLTPDMERKIVFLTSQVRFGQQKRYQDWFQRQYLSTPESQSLRCDLIRFICGVIHPPNEVLGSDIIPRWAVIGWILSSCTSNVHAANAKLSLFFDWLFYDPERDNIMNIEPAILVMWHSNRSHPAITCTLLDFLCRILPHFHPPLTTSIRKGICTSLQVILEKRVVTPSLAPLFEAPKLDAELKQLIRQTFPEFCGQGTVSSSDQLINREVEVIREVTPPTDSEARFSDEENEEVKGKLKVPTNTTTTTTTATTSAAATSSSSASTSAPASSSSSSSPSSCSSSATSSSSTCTTSAAAITPGKGNTSPLITSAASVPPLQSVTSATNGLVKAAKPINLPSKGDVDDFMFQLTDEMRKTVTKMVEEKDFEGKCRQMETLLQLVIESDLDQEMSLALAGSLVYHLQEEIVKKIYPCTGSSSLPDDEVLEDSVGTPFFIILRFFTSCSEDDPSRLTIASLLNDMSSFVHCIGYCLLYYMKVCKKSDTTCYKELAKLGTSKDLSSFLLEDLSRCQNDDVDMFCFILPFIYQNFENIVLANSSFLHLVVSCLDAYQLQDLICFVLKGDIRMLKKENIVQFINASLEWETFEQNCLWHLINAHSLPIESFLPVLSKLEYGSHSEALTGILLSLRQQEPTTELVKHVITRDPKDGDKFSITILMFWIRNYEKKMAEIVASHLVKGNSPAKRKRQHSSKGTLSATAEQTLVHLNHIRQNSDLGNSFVLTDQIQAALLSVQNHCTEAQKARFADLFEQTEEYEAKPSKKKAAASKKKGRVEEASSDSDASEDEVPVTKSSKSSSQRKRRKAATFSDSE